MCAPEVPCGRLAQEILADAGVDARPVSLEENVRAVLTKVELGEADAGIVFTTDVAAAGGAVEGVVMPPDQNAVTTVVMALTTETSNPEAAAAFVDFVTGAEGQAVLASYGFGSP
jgi:molybdate transport system substrate-binding protein